MRAAAFVLLVGVVVLSGCSNDVDRSATTLEAELQRVCAGREFWPGYDPLVVPLAVFDGESTFLFRHPSPPQGFVANDGVHVCVGRYESVVANSSTRIGGVSTATVMLESLSPESTIREWAALVIHEGFHVFQGATGRAWGANEVELFRYPVDDDELLTLRRLEAEALRRAFRASELDSMRGWVAQALAVRRERFAKMEPGFRMYERGIEAHEGTATYVQYAAAGQVLPDIPSGGFDAEDVRGRAYITGVAWALLLDVFSSGWQASFGSDDSLNLDTSVAEAIAAADASRSECAFTESELAAAAHRAEADVERVLEERMRVRQVQPADRDAWIRLRTELWPMHSAADAARDVDEYYSSPGRAGVFVAEDDSNRIVGFVEASLREQAERCTTTPVGYLEAWYVAEGLRERGVGRALVDAAERWAQGQGCTEMASDCVLDNSVSFEAHTALGYEETLRLIHLRKSLGGGT